jgi:hypothetical protein
MQFDGSNTKLIGSIKAMTLIAPAATHGGHSTSHPIGMDDPNSIVDNGNVTIQSSLNE